jgi:TonB-linked SusC/RagA family outer membrane protein
MKYFFVLSLVCMISLSAYAQSIPITGTVTDAGGESLPGANVTIKGSTAGVVGDANGKFSINVPNSEAVLQFSFVGYATQEITVGDKTVIDVVLSESAGTIEEVVVVGYGSQKKVTLTGAVAAIGSKDIVITKHNNIENSLTGKIAGVKVIQRSSEPGVFNNEFSIRGMGKPLIVIDGVPRDNMVRMDENEIESISILKDASAAIYGTRAANGVVLITTKKGQGEKKFQFDYNGLIGGQRFLYKPELLDAIGYMQLRNERAVNNGGVFEYQYPTSFDPYLDGTKESTDWWNPFVKKFPLQMQHNFSATGSGDKVDYFVNFGYYTQDGLWKSDDASSYDRFNLRSNVTARLAKGLKMDVLLNLMQDTRMTQPEGTWRLFRAAWNLLPVDPYYVNGDPNYPYNGNITYLMDIDKGGYNRYIERLIQTNLALEWEIPGVTGLTAKAMYSYDYKEDENKIFRKPYVTYDLNLTPGGSSYNLIERDYYGYTNSLLQLSLNYAKSFGEHNLSVLALYEESDRQGDNFKASRDVTIDAVDQLFAGNAANPKNDQEKGTNDEPRLFHFANKGLVGRLTYDYASKYLVDFSFRYDGSSLFGEGHQWGFFPVASVGWRLSEEAFIKDSQSLGFINNLKIRASYGTMGDDGNSQYQFLTGYDYPGAEGYVVGGKYTNTVGIRGVSNRMLSWISATTLDIGLDAELWKGLLGISVDIFQRNRSGLMATRGATLPLEVGMTLPQENLNSDKTQGFEVTLTHRNKIGKEFSYYASGNIAFDRTMSKYVEITSFGSEYENWRNNTNDRWQNIIWGVDYLGQYQSFDEIWASGLIYDNSNAQGNTRMLPGDLIEGDWNGDGIIDGNDVHPIRIGTPRKPLITYGFSLGAEYKGIDLNLVFAGTAMSRVRFAGYRNYYEGPFGENAGTGGAGNGWTVFLDRWHRADETNPSNDQEWIAGKYPSTNVNNNRGFVRAYNSDFWVQNSSFLRLKSLELGYTIPKNISTKVGISRARIFVNAYNLFTITKMTIADPEYQNTDGDDPMMYPLAQTYNVGLNLSF